MYLAKKPLRNSVFLNNFIWLSVSASSITVSMKLKVNNGAEMMVKEIEIEGLLSIQAGENPRVIEEKLKSFLAPSERGQFEEGEEGAGAAGGGEQNG